MCGEPTARTLEIVVIRIESHQVDRQLAPSDYLVEECFLVRLGCVRLLYGQRDGKRTDMPEMQIGRKPAGSVHLRLVSVGAIGGQPVLAEVFQKSQGFVGAAAKA